MADPNAPAPVLDAEGRIHVANRMGDVVRVAPEELEAAQAQGYSVVDQPTVAEAVKREDNSGLGSMIAAGAAGVARGLTLGGSDVIAGALGAGEKLEALKRYNPISSIGGEVVGNIAGLGLATPVRGAVAAGEAVGGVVAKGVGKGILSATAQATTEGAIFGAGQAVSEAALGDKYDKLGELLASEIGLGAMMGGGAGLALSLASRGAHAMTGSLRRGVADAAAAPTAESIENLARGTFGSSSPEVGAAVAEQLSKPSLPERLLGWAAGAFKGPEEKAIIARAMSPEVRYRMVNHDRILTDAATDLTKNLADAHKTMGLTAERFMGKMKRAEIRAAVTDANKAAAMDLAQQSVASMRAGLSRAADPMSGLSLEGLKFKALNDQLTRLEKMVAEHQAQLGWSSNQPHLKIPVDEDKLVDIFMGLDEMKRSLGKRAASFAKKGGDDLHGLSVQQRATRDWTIQEYKNLRSQLEHDVWGEAAKKQAAINKPWSALIDSEMRAGEHSFRAGFTKSPVTGEFGATSAVVDGDKVMRWLKSIGPDAASSEKLASVRQWLDNTESFVAASREHLDLPPAVRAKAEQFQEMADKLRASIDYAAKVGVDGAQYQALTGTSAGASMTKGLVGYALGGAPGAAVAGVLDAVTNPKRLISTLAAVDQITGRGTKRMTQALQSIGEKAVTAPKRSIAGAVAAQFGLKGGEDRNQEREFNRRTQTLEELASIPRAPAQLAAAAFSDIAGAAPSVTAAAAVSLERQVNYLQSVLPKLGMRNPFTARPSASKSEKQQFNARARAAEDPAALLERIVSGKATIWDIEATAAVAPATFGDMQSSVLHLVADMAGEGKTLPYQERIRLDMALGLNMEPMAMPEMIADMQAAFAAMQPGPQPGPTDAQVQQSTQGAASRIDRLER